MVKPSRKKSKNKTSFLPLILLTGFIAFVSLAFYSLNKSDRLETRGQAAEPVYNRILWNGANWYLHGANIPWYNWGCDFGCNEDIGKSGGVSTNKATLSAGFAQAQQAGMHTLRWWLFPGDPWQITRDSNGSPNGINPAVYKDIDAALALAQQYNMYYNFVLFSAPTAMPLDWQTDATKRSKLVEALGTLFAHYKSHPRILSWEIYNEPENDIWNNKIDQKSVVDTGTAIAQSVHSNSPGTLVTVGSLFADGMKMWLNAGLDYYSPHWYDYMANGDYCMICNTYDYYAKWGVNKPIVVGEYYTANASTTPYSAMYRMDYWYEKGYAGAWAWSLFPNQTNDRLATDISQSAIFAAKHIDIGPLNAVPSPTPTIHSVIPSPTPTPIIILLPTNTPSVPSPTLKITSPTPTTTIKSFTITNPSVKNVTGTAATIAWRTSQPATGQVQYGTSSINMNTFSSISTTLRRNQSIRLQNLQRNTRYYYRMHSKNSAGVQVVSGVYSFYTRR